MLGKKRFGKSKLRVQMGLNCEPLEQRMLLTVVLSKGANGLITVTESATGVANNLTVSVDDALTTQTISDSSDTLITVNGLGAEGWTISSNGHSASGPLRTIGNLVIDTKDGLDTVELRSCTVPVVVQPSGSAAETVRIGNGTAAQEVTGTVMFDATNAASGELSIEDQSDTNHIDPTLAAGNVYGVTPQAISFTPPVAASASNPLDVVLYTGSGGSAPIIAQEAGSTAPVEYDLLSNGQDQIGVQTLNASSLVTINAQAGARDSVFLGSLHSIRGIQGSVRISGGMPNSTAVTIDDSDDPTPEQFDIAPLSLQLQVKKNGSPLLIFDADEINNFTLMTGTESNTVSADFASNFPSGAALSLIFDASDGLGGGGNADITGLSSDGRLEISGSNRVTVNQLDVQGAVMVDGRADTGTELIVDGSTLTNDHIVSVSSTAVTGLGNGSEFMTNVSGVSVTGGTGFDDFRVRLSPTTTISVDGGPLGASAPTDRLTVISDQTPVLQLTADSTGDHGSYLLPSAVGTPGGGEVDFQHFGSISPVFGSISGTVFNQQTGAPAANLTLALDVNGNGIDSTDPTSTSDANGQFSFTNLAAGTYPVLISSGAVGLATPVSVTVSATALSTPLTLPVVPLPAVAGPDLTASVVASIVKGASNKPKAVVKITDIGAAMAAGATVQVELLASSDQALSPDDSKLLTVAVPLRLGARASKTFTLTGSTASSLVPGTYFVLASVDTANSVAETNESNNVGVSRSLALAPASVDLSGKFAALPRSAAKAKGLTAPLTLTNTGNTAAAGGSVVDFYASTDRTLDDSDIALGSEPIGVHLAAGKSQNLKFKLPLTTVAAGGYFLIAKINPAQSISESSYANNQVFSATPIVIG